MSMMMKGKAKEEYRDKGNNNTSDWYKKWATAASIKWYDRKAQTATKKTATMATFVEDENDYLK